MSQLDLSVIVTCYNLQPYLRRCLNSILNTSFPHRRMEVLMIDDGSTDATGSIVDQYDDRYPNFRAIHKVNQGVSIARNYGMDLARGKYIAFVDGDDVVPTNAYTDLMYTAEIQHSEIVSGFVNRFDRFNRHGSYLHRFAIKGNRFQTTLAQDPALLYDTTIWNKVYSRSFLVRNHLRFIPHILYEDLPFTLAAHLKSANTSTIKDVVYDWRWRPNSVTQSRDTFSNYQSRLHALNLCWNLLLDNGFKPSGKVFTAFKWKVLFLDLPIFLENIGNSTETYVYRVQEITYRFLRDWHLLNSPILPKLTLKNQIIYYAIKSGNLALLRRFTYTKKVGKFKTNFWNKHYHFVPRDLDYQTLRHLNLTDNSLRVKQNLVKVHVNRNRHVIHGHGMFRIRKLHLHRKLFSRRNNYREKLSARLVNIFSHKSMPIHFIRRHTQFYKRVLLPESGWTNSRYNFSFNYVAALKKLGRGDWLIRAEDVIDDKYYVASYLGAPLRTKRMLFYPVSERGSLITGTFSTDRKLVFAVRSAEKIGVNVNWLGRITVTGSKLILRAKLVSPKSITPIIKLTPNQTIDGTIHKLKGPHSYRIIFDLSGWPAGLVHRPVPIWVLHTKTNYLLPYLHSTRQHYRYYRINHYQDLLVSYNSNHALYISLEYRPAIVTHYRLVNHRQLLVRAHLAWPVESVNAICVWLLNRNLKRRYVLTPAKNHMKLTKRSLWFSVSLLSPDLKQPLILKGKYRFTVHLLVGNQSIEFGLTLAHPRQNSMAHRIRLKTKLKDPVAYRVAQNHQGFLQLRIYQPKTGFDKKRSHRAIGYSVIYPLMRLLPLRRTMIFNSHWNFKASPNERAIYEYVCHHDPKIKTVWFFKNRLTPIDGNGLRVKRGTLRYWYYLATAKYLVQNTNLPNRYLKRAGQIEVESLHGTAFQPMGFDKERLKCANYDTQAQFAKRNRRWDYVIIPSEYMRKIATRAFDYHQKFIPAGFPQNDELIRHHHYAYVDRIKHKLGIPLNKTVILYAPAYRGKHADNFHLNLTNLMQQLPDRDVLLLKLNSLVSHVSDFSSYSGFVYDVSDYPDVNDLLLISDVLVTDYSKLMFDYAYLNRPMIFYAYDDEKLQRTYFDYRRTVPGPVVKTEKGLVKALLNLKAVTSKYHDRIMKFHRKFAQYGNRGDAAKRVVKTILNTQRRNLNQIPDRDVVFNKFWHGFHIKDIQLRLLNWLGQILPKRKIVMFESFFGTQYSDNPKAIYLYFKRYYPDYQLYWDVDSQDAAYFSSHQIPYVERFSYQGLLKKAQAKYWVTNCRRPLQWRVPKGTILLQTWHGTPLKKVGEDVNVVRRPGNSTRNYHRQVYDDDRRWNYLLTPNLYSTRIMAKAFRMKANQLMLTGYPRNDILRNYNALQINAIKRQLGIKRGQKVILYAPTWRDHEYVRSGEFTFRLHLDLGLLKRHFGQKAVVLVRTHYLVANQLDLSKYHGTALDVSNYQDINDLYLVSDVLITDYSSAMFDYAILKRPMIFFDYDLGQGYQSSDFYLKLKKWLPGKIVRTTPQVVSELDRIFNGRWRLNANYRYFLRHFAAWSDGHSTDRVVHQLISGQNVREHFISRSRLKLPKFVLVRDGSSMWKPHKDFTTSNRTDFAGNYDYDGQKFKVLLGMQLQSISFRKPLGIRYLLVKASWSRQPVWVAQHDVVRIGQS